MEAVLMLAMEISPARIQLVFMAQRALPKNGAVMLDKKGVNLIRKVGFKTTEILEIALEIFNNKLALEPMR
jgi:hypothetical protein